MKLIYRGSRDGMTGKDFHKKCDKKGETITLIKMRKEIYLEDMLLFLGQVKLNFIMLQIIFIYI